MIGAAGEETLKALSSRFSCEHVDLGSTIPSGLPISAFRSFPDTPEVATMVFDSCVFFLEHDDS